MADITEIAVASWRLERWLDNVNVERKMAAKSALRSIKRYLQENEIEVVDLTGSKFDVGLAVSVVNNESDEIDEEKLIISEMVKPIIKERGSVIQYGQVILGDEVKQPKVNRVIKNTPAEATIEKEIAIAESLENASQKDLSSTGNEKDLKEDLIHEHPKESESSDKRTKVKILLWTSILLLQFVAIGLLVKMRNDFNRAMQYKESHVSEEENNTAAMKKISDLEKRVKAVNNKVDDLDAKLNNMNGTISEISEYVTKKQESEQKDSSKEDTQKEQSQDREYRTYVVKPGDTLISICKANGIDYYGHKEEIMELNGITDPNTISIGQELRLPK